MEVGELIKGISVVIDDDINNENENISKIVKQIETENIPILKYNKLPDIETIKNFRNLSFLILDWRLVKDDYTSGDIEAGVKLPTGLSDELIEESIDFLKEIREVCFCPVFIFSNEDKESIQNHLITNELYLEDRPNQIFIKSKDELLEAGDFINEVTNWITNNPSIYVLKEWEKEYQKCKNKLFFDFFKLSPSWPSILWRNFEVDGVNKSTGIGDVISSNLHSRMVPYDFDDDIINKSRKEEIDLDEIKGVIEGERYIVNEGLNSEDISPGDLFKYQGKYYLNIRPSCDLITGRGDSSDSINDINLYLIRGTKLNETKIGEQFRPEFGNFLENDTNIIIFPVDGYNAIDFRFKDLKVEPWSNWKSKRKGRILSPFINRVQQKYSLYSQRLGLPRIPESLFPKNPDG
ncbi:MAG: hypothetical protein ACK5L8_04975 [Marinicella pacifica]